jgi:ABC-type glycerol-3-phosphate transport system substrate-binding protein
MQQNDPANPSQSARTDEGTLSRRAAAAGLLAAGLSALLTGCWDASGNSPPAEADRPLAGTTLTLSCPDARLASLLAPLANVWAARTGAAVTVTTAAMAPGDAVEVGVLPFAELGTWAERGALLPVPAALKEAGHPYQWSGVLAVYRGEPFAGWGGQLVGLPLAADGHVVVYRADRFADPQAKADFQVQFQRPLAAPSTWEEFADAAAFFAARDKRPSLPRLTADPARLADLFFRVAACYDRPALGETGARGAAPSQADALAFQFNPDDGKPRLNSPGFEAAAGWLAGLKARGCLPANGPADPAQALAQDRAVLAVLSLAELHSLKANGKVPERYGLRALPGTRRYIDPQSGKLAEAPSGNYVPYFAGGWLGVVRTGCKSPDAAFDLLATLGGPARSAELIAAGGYGPTRDAHLDQTQLLMWLGYGLDPERSRGLQDALRQNVAKAVRNPTYGLRTPDHAALTAALGGELQQVAAGGVKPDEGMRRTEAAWGAATAGTPPGKLREWRRKAVGLN